MAILCFKGEQDMLVGTATYLVAYMNKRARPTKWILCKDDYITVIVTLDNYKFSFLFSSKHGKDVS